MLTIVAFLLALGLLIAVHEYGHYRVAVACGVKVIRFSIGFGKVLFRWRPRGSSTEFVLAAFPVGGFVKMLDEREAPVLEAERHLAFNNQPLFARVAIVAAGPLANLLLAVLLYALVHWSGVQLPAPILATPVAGSVAEEAGLIGGEHVLRAGFSGEELEVVESFDDLRWLLTRGALQKQDVNLDVTGSAQGLGHQVVLSLQGLDSNMVDSALLQRIGIVSPYSRPVIGKVIPGSVADMAGLREGDIVRQFGAVEVIDGQQLRQLIRTSIKKNEPVTNTWTISRANSLFQITVMPALQQEEGVLVGKIGAYVGAMPELVMVRYGAFEGFQRGVLRTWEMSVLTLRMMGRMLVGEASFKNLSGPLTIADYAGKSADIGLTQYVLFLALISVSLGVMNLLPLPVLDGGHLMYYLWEGMTGMPVSDIWMERLQRVGVAILFFMMSIALFNDITRLFG